MLFLTADLRWQITRLLAVPAKLRMIPAADLRRFCIGWQSLQRAFHLVDRHQSVPIAIDNSDRQITAAEIDMRFGVGCQERQTIDTIAVTVGETRRHYPTKRMSANDPALNGRERGNDIASRARTQNGKVKRHRNDYREAPRLSERSTQGRVCFRRDPPPQDRK